jgi:hypothetical protein
MSDSSQSSTANSLSDSDEQLVQNEKLISCLSIQALGYEDEYADDKCDDWNVGWEIFTAPAKGTKKGTGRLERVPTPELSLIKEGDFEYYPTPKIGRNREDRGGVEKKGDDGSLKLARRRLVGKRSGRGEAGLSLGRWFKELLGQMGLGRQN